MTDVGPDPIGPDAWVHANLDELGGYADRWVAVHRSEVIESDEDFASLLERVDRRGVLDTTALAFIRDEDDDVADGGGEVEEPDGL